VTELFWFSTALKLPALFLRSRCPPAGQKETERTDFEVPSSRAAQDAIVRNKTPSKGHSTSEVHSLLRVFLTEDFPTFPTPATLSWRQRLDQR